jgi:sulfur-oxidizing protein SoxZ
VPAWAKRGEVIELRILIQHAMEPGYRRDEVGREIPRNVIHAFVCRYNGVEVFRADLSSGISANPYLRFHTVADASGEIEFSWSDDEGKQETERVAIVVGA